MKFFRQRPAANFGMIIVAIAAVKTAAMIMAKTMMMAVMRTVAVAVARTMAMIMMGWRRWRR